MWGHPTHQRVRHTRTCSYHINSGYPRQLQHLRTRLHIYTDASVLFALHARRHASARLLALFTPRLGHGPETAGLVPWSKAGLQRARNGRQHPQPVLLKVRLSSLPRIVTAAPLG